MYDKFGIILRIETTTNDVSQFRHYREVQHHDGSKESKVAPMKKNIYSLYILAQLLKESNRRYLEFISTFDDPSDGIKKLAKISDPVKKDQRSYKGFNFFSHIGFLKSWPGESLTSTVFKTRRSVNLCPN
jgi:hypothetical protein